MLRSWEHKATAPITKAIVYVRHFPSNLYHSIRILWCSIKLKTKSNGMARTPLHSDCLFRSIAGEIQIQLWFASFDFGYRDDFSSLLFYCHSIKIEVELNRIYLPIKSIRMYHIHCSSHSIHSFIYLFSSISNWANIICLRLVDGEWWMVIGRRGQCFAQKRNKNCFSKLISWRFG